MMINVLDANVKFLMSARPFMRFMVDWNVGNKPLGVYFVSWCSEMCLLNIFNISHLCICCR